MNTAVKNFNLHIEKASGKDFFAALLKDDKGKVLAANKFRFKFDASILTRLEDSAGKNIKRNANLIKGVGSTLFNAVFKGKILSSYRANRHKHIRLKLFLKKEEPELLRVPWEFMFDGKNFISACHKATIMRIVKGISSGKKGNIKGKIKMLAVISSPVDLPESHRLHVEKEIMIIMQAVAHGFVADKIEIDFLHEASLKNIQEKLSNGEYHIFHFTGHGIYSRREGLCYLLLEDDLGSAVRVEHGAIANILAMPKSLRLVVLSGCQTAVAVGHRVIGDLPLPLLAKEIPAVLTMQYSVTDQSAMDLARKFYSEICNRVPLDLALTNARRELLAGGKKGIVDFATPVLYCDDPYCLQAESR